MSSATTSSMMGMVRATHSVMPSALSVLRSASCCSTTSWSAACRLSTFSGPWSLRDMDSLKAHDASGPIWTPVHTSRWGSVEGTVSWRAGPANGSKSSGSSWVSSGGKEFGVFIGSRSA
ncbi:hypothetical protein COSO111634_36955 [Corallococcus soli]